MTDSIPATAAERLIEVTIGLWPDDDPPGMRPPRLAAGIVKALRDEGYEIRAVTGIHKDPTTGGTA